jgi:DUF4097 and DUF4098 domain-containing protein YvlB
MNYRRFAFGFWLDQSGDLAAGLKRHWYGIVGLEPRVNPRTFYRCHQRFFLRQYPMRLGVVLIVAGVLLFFATTPNGAWLARGTRVVSEVGEQIDGQLVSGSKTTTQDYDLASINTLQLETFSGEIEVEIGKTMTSQGTFRLEAVGHQQLPEVLRDGATLSIRATRQPCNTCALHYRIKLGKAMHLELKGANGSIVVLGLTNSLRVSQQNGELALSDLGKTILQLVNQNGSITVQNAQLEAGSQNRIENQNGDVGLHNLSGNGGLMIQTSAQNGEINNEVGNTSGDDPAKLEVDTQNGDITLTRER